MCGCFGLFQSLGNALTFSRKGWVGQSHVGKNFPPKKHSLESLLIFSRICYADRGPLMRSGVKCHAGSGSYRLVTDSLGCLSVQVSLRGQGAVIRCFWKGIRYWLIYRSFWSTALKSSELTFVICKGHLYLSSWGHKFMLRISTMFQWPFRCPHSGSNCSDFVCINMKECEMK